MLCTSSEHLSWEFIKEKKKDLKTCFFLSRDLVFLMKILFSFLFSLWSSCFLPFFLMICTSSEHLSWGFIKEKEKDFKTCFFLVFPSSFLGKGHIFLVKILFLSCFLGQVRVFFLFLLNLTFFGWKRVFFYSSNLFFLNSNHYCCFFHTI